MGKLLCFGELLLRLAPELNGEWIKKSSTPVYIGGAELNVAKALALWGNDVRYFTSIPADSLTREIVESLKNEHIDTGSILFQQGRTGIYYLPQGADLKHSEVIYDRAYSSFYNLKPGMIDWKHILEDVSWFHFSAITPALNESLAAVCEEGLKVAKSMNIPVSVDLNYRSKLWKYGKAPVEVMPGLVDYCDTIMGNIWSAHSLLNNSISNHISEFKSREEYLQEAKNSANQLLQRFRSCRQVAYTFRFDEQQGIRYYGTLINKADQYNSAEYSSDQIIDKVGSGDCFMAGLIHSHNHSYSDQETIEFATAAAFTKLQIEGDSTTLTVEEINNYRK